MNISSLAPLGDRWPNDAVTIPLDNIMDVPAVALAMVASIKSSDYFIKLLHQDEADQQVIRRFAEDNDMQYAPYDQSLVSFSNPNDTYKTRPAWAGFAASTSPYLATHVVTGKFRGYPIKMFVAGLVTDNNAEVPPEHRRNMSLLSKGIIKVKLSKVFPQMVLDSNKNDKGISSSIDISFNSDQKIILEGDFASYFDFFAPHGLQVNALTVLAPNFMQLMKDSSATFDVEFYGDEMILITKNPLFTETVMTEVGRALDEQLAYLDRLLLSWNYVPKNPPFDLLQRSFFGGSVVKVGKFRITPKQIVVFALIVFLTPLVIFLGFMGLFVLLIAIS